MRPVDPAAGVTPLGAPVLRRRVLPPIRPSWVQIVLFVATSVSTFVMYAFFQGGNPFTDLAVAREALAFSTTLLTILGIHELGHFVVGRRHDVDVSLPYFIPAPNLLGTFGAVIRIRSAIEDRRALLLIGAAGPIAGFAVAVPAVIWGVATSEVALIDGDEGLIIGAPLLFQWIAGWLHGPLTDGQALNLGAVAFAGWAGLFLTAFNLLPLGQLDGGHIIYAVCGRRTWLVSLPVLAVLVGMGLTLWLGWLVVSVLVLLFGFRHPPVREGGPGLAGMHRAVAVLSLLILVVCFTPVPIAIV